MKTKWIIAVSLGLLFGLAVSANADQPPREVVSGDTLWDLSGQFWGKPPAWPELWSQNPHIHNPHWIYPGDLLFLRAAKPQPRIHEVELVVEKLMPPEPEPVEAAVEEVTETPVTDKVFKPFLLSEKRVQDYISPKRIRRIGTVDNYQVRKIGSVEGEQVQFRIPKEAPIKVGDKLTIFDDERRIVFPGTEDFVGHQVHICAHMKVLDIDWNNGLARGEIFKSYDVVEDGYGVMAFREPILSVMPQSGNDVEGGVVLAGFKRIVMFATDDTIFLNKGADDGLEPGMVFLIPYIQEPFDAEGMTVDMDRPLGRMVVVSTEPTTATATIHASRRAVVAGQRFVGLTISP